MSRSPEQPAPPSPSDDEAELWREAVLRIVRRKSAERRRIGDWSDKEVRTAMRRMAFREEVSDQLLRLLREGRAS